MYSFPSFEKIITETRATLMRFPLEILVAILGTLCAIYCTDEKNNEQQRMYIKIIMACSLCLVLFLSISLYFSRDKKNNAARFISSLILGSMLFVFIFQFSEQIKTFETYQFLSLNLALHFTGFFCYFYQYKI